MKLIRDKTPDLLRGTTRTVRDNVEHEILLRAKLMEEAAECAASTSDEEFIAEAGDLLQVIKTLCILKGITLNQIVDASEEKYLRKGGFDGGLVLVFDPLSNKTHATV
jgi:predicted house-cleaning noncanonical NTP pyrophosphatase (MazG superfamily)